ncbi:MAG TPA: nucleoside monophosphate kinase [Bryobacteraceae bacterium]|nr:nucleoside monophosphate kinase [Bryobacteraceae bacterium]
MIVLVFGPPGCGKGTQASLVAGRYGIPAISTGELFRSECQAGTPLGRQACSIMARGGLVGDDIVNRMVVERVARPDCRAGFLLDGFPRTRPQAEFFDGVLSARGLPEPVVIHLEVPSKVLVRRLSARRQCPVCARVYNVLSHPPRIHGLCDDDGAALTARQDDSEPVIRRRLTAYEEVTRPVIKHYRGGRYYRVNGDRSPDAVHGEIAGLLAPCVHA